VDLPSLVSLQSDGLAVSAMFNALATGATRDTRSAATRMIRRIESPLSQKNGSGQRSGPVLLIVVRLKFGAAFLDRAPPPLIAGVPLHGETQRLIEIGVAFEAQPLELRRVE